MQPRATSCPYCRVVNLLCFWGPRPEAPWNRLVSILLAASAVVALVAFSWFFLSGLTLLVDCALLLLFLLTVLSIVVGF